MVYGVEGLLLAAIGGYWVLERASAQKGQLRQVGLFLGSLVIVMSLLGVLAEVWSMGACPVVNGGRMGMMGKRERPAPMMMPRPNQAIPTPKD